MSEKKLGDSPASRLERYRALADTARREAHRRDGEARESYLFIAQQWELLAEMALKHAKAAPTTSLG